MSGALGHSHHEEQNMRLSGTSDGSVSSSDSGYASMAHEAEPSRTETRKPFGLSAIFKRKDKAINTIKSKGISALTSMGAPVLPAPSSEAPVRQPQTG
jgi:hypothetical protein